MTGHRRSLLLVLALGLTLGLTLGCEAQRDAAKLAKPKPTFKPHLPAPPDYDEISKLPVKADDGSWTVNGVVKNRRALLGREVRVSGEIGERHLCRDRKGCPKRPYFMLVSPEARQIALMVVRENDQGFSMFKTGEPLTLVGELVDHTSDGKLFRSDGILMIPGGEDEPQDQAPESGDREVVQ